MVNLTLPCECGVDSFTWTMVVLVDVLDLIDKIELYLGWDLGLTILDGYTFYDPCWNHFYI